MEVLAVRGVAVVDQCQCSVNGMQAAKSQYVYTPYMELRGQYCERFCTRGPASVLSQWDAGSEVTKCLHSTYGIMWKY